MNVEAQPKQQQSSAATSSSNSDPDNFDFALWAREVRHQMLASLRKRGNPT